MKGHWAAGSSGLGDGSASFYSTVKSGPANWKPHIRWWPGHGGFWSMWLTPYWKINAKTISQVRYAARALQEKWAR